MPAWLKAKRGPQKLRDGFGKSDPVRKLTTKPVPFINKEPDEFDGDNDIVALKDRKPPTEEDVKKYEAELKREAEEKAAAQKKAEEEAAAAAAKKAAKPK